MVTYSTGLRTELQVTGEIQVHGEPLPIITFLRFLNLLLQAFTLFQPLQQGHLPL